MSERARFSFYWPGIPYDIKRSALMCTPCQTNLPSQQKESFTVLRHERLRLHMLTSFILAGSTSRCMLTNFQDGLVFSWWKQKLLLPIYSCLTWLFLWKSVPVQLYSDGGPQFTSRTISQSLKTKVVTGTTWSTTNSPVIVYFGVFGDAFPSNSLIS